MTISITINGANWDEVRAQLRLLPLDANAERPNVAPVVSVQEEPATGPTPEAEAPAPEPKKPVKSAAKSPLFRKAPPSAPEAPPAAKEPDPVSEPQPLTPAALIDLRAKTLSELQAAYANGKQTQVFKLLADLGNGAKSFRELQLEDFPPLRKAIDEGALA